MTDTRQNRRVWFITGASSGFGNTLATAALDRGDLVVAAARRVPVLDHPAGTDPDRVLALSLDVTDAEQRTEAVQRTIDRFGRLDVLVNNAGRTQVGAVEETTDQELRDLFDLHFFAPVALTAAALPHMRRRGSGVIVQMSSVGGQAVGPGFGAYCATKFALEGLSETLAEEVAPLGIRVLIVEPGAFRTGLFGPGAYHFSAELPAYADTVGPTRRYVLEGNGAQPGDPVKAVAAIMAAIDADDPPLRLVLGSDAVDRIVARLERLRDEIARWERLSRATAFERPSAT